MELFKSIKDDKDDIQLQSLTIPKFASIEYTADSLIKKLSNINNLSTEEIKEILLKHHSTILNYDLFFSNYDIRTYSQKLFTNSRFLKIFIDIAGLMKLSDDEIICINKLAYDYYNSNNKDNNIMDLFLQLSWIINNNTVIKLSSILSINDSRLLSLISKSSFKIDKNIHRINNFIMRKDNLSVQDIINIYCILFNNKFMNLFINSMLEYNTTDKYTNQVSVMFDKISQALIAILLSMTTADIKTILINYAYKLKSKNNNEKISVRFSLQSIQDKRLQGIIYDIQYLDNPFDYDDTLYIP